MCIRKYCADGVSRGVACPLFQIVACGFGFRSRSRPCRGARGTATRTRAGSGGAPRRPRQPRSRPARRSSQRRRRATERFGTSQPAPLPASPASDRTRTRPSEMLFWLAGLDWPRHTHANPHAPTPTRCDTHTKLRHKQNRRMRVKHPPPPPLTNQTPRRRRQGSPTSNAVGKRMLLRRILQLVRTLRTVRTYI